MKRLLIIGVVLVLAYEYMKAQQAGVPATAFPRWFFTSALGFGPGSGNGNGPANNTNRYEYGRPNASNWKPVDGPLTFFYGKTYQKVYPAQSCATSVDAYGVPHTVCNDPSSQGKTVWTNTSVYDQSPLDASQGGACLGCAGGGAGSAAANPAGASQSWLTHL